MLRFRLFGFPVSVLPGFWLLVALLGMWVGHSSILGVLLIGGVAFISVLAHELGHAFAARRVGLNPSITLHLTGGATTYAAVKKLSRGKDIAITAAGPLAGFGLALVAFVLYSLYARSPDPREASWFVSVLLQTVELNVLWSVVNLIPVIPFDGGRILMAALGEHRRVLAAGISLAVGAAVAYGFLSIGQLFGAVLFGSAALSSFFRLRQASQVRDQVSEASLKQALSAAEEALRKGTFEQAALLSQGVLGASSDPDLRQKALETLLWAHLGAGDAQGANAILGSLPRGELDAYLAGAVHEASGQLDQAKEVLTSARSAGDDRVEVTALLVKVLLEREQYAEAANLTREILQKIQPEEARRVAEAASDGGAQVEAGRLSLELARIETCFSDARDALLRFARAGARSEAAEAYRLAVGFDRERGEKLLDDERLRGMRTELGPNPVSIDR